MSCWWVTAVSAASSARCSPRRTCRSLLSKATRKGLPSRKNKELRPSPAMPLTPILSVRPTYLPPAAWLVAIPDAFEGGQVVEQASKLSPKLSIIARAHSEAEVLHLKKHGASVVILGEHEIARAMIELVSQAEPNLPISGA